MEKPNKKELKVIISNAAEAHARDVLGDEEFKKNKTAAKAIMKDFESGANWMYPFCLDHKISK